MLTICKIKQLSVGLQFSDEDLPRPGPGGWPPDHLEADTAGPDPLEDRNGLVVTESVQGLSVD